MVSEGGFSMNGGWDCLSVSTSESWPTDRWMVSVYNSWCPSAERPHGFILEFLWAHLYPMFVPYPLGVFEHGVYPWTAGEMKALLWMSLQPFSGIFHMAPVRLATSPWINLWGSTAQGCTWMHSPKSQIVWWWNQHKSPLCHDTSGADSSTFAPGFAQLDSPLFVPRQGIWNAGTWGMTILKTHWDPKSIWEDEASPGQMNH